jgi:hypothetical protein
MDKKGEIMTRVIENINNINIPTNIRREIGLPDNWKEKISPKKVEKIAKSALKYKEALRKLSKN